MTLKDIDKPVANTILSRYGKGIEGDCSNAIIVKQNIKVLIVYDE